MLSSISRRKKSFICNTFYDFERVAGHDYVGRECSTCPLFTFSVLILWNFCISWILSYLLTISAVTERRNEGLSWRMLDQGSAGSDMVSSRTFSGVGDTTAHAASVQRHCRFYHKIKLLIMTPTVLERQRGKGTLIRRNRLVNTPRPQRPRWFLCGHTVGL